MRGTTFSHQLEDSRLKNALDTVLVRAAAGEREGRNAETVLFLKTVLLHCGLWPNKCSPCWLLQLPRESAFGSLRLLLKCLLPSKDGFGPFKQRTFTIR